MAVNNRVDQSFAEGPVVRISQNDLITDDPEIFLRINAVRSPYSRSEFYAGARLDPYRDNIISCRDEVKHQELRTKMAAGVCRIFNLLFHLVTRNDVALTPE